MAGQGRAHHPRPDRQDAVFENAQLEFFGVPMAYVPYFSTPDPTVKRKSGFLMPGFSSNSTYGFGVEIPYYWAIAPDYDATFTPRFMTDQGVLLQGEFRQRLADGSYQVRAYGIDQQKPDALPVSPETAPSAAALKQRASSHSTIMGLGLGRRRAHRLHDVVGLQAGAVQGPPAVVSHLADGSHFPALCDRSRQPQLLRRTLDLLSQPVRQSVSGARRCAG